MQSHLANSTTSLGRLFTVKNFFLMWRWDLSPCNLYPLPLVFSIHVLMKRKPPSSSYLYFKYWNIAMRSTLSLLLSKEKRPHPSVFPCRVSSSSLWSSLWTSFGPSQICLNLFGILGTQTGHSTPDAAWRVMSRVEWSHVYPC